MDSSLRALRNAGNDGAGRDFVKFEFDVILRAGACILNEKPHEIATRGFLRSQ